MPKIRGPDGKTYEVTSGKVTEVAARPLSSGTIAGPVFTSTDDGNAMMHMMEDDYGSMMHMMEDDYGSMMHMMEDSSHSIHLSAH